MYTRIVPISIRGVGIAQRSAAATVLRTLSSASSAPPVKQKQQPVCSLSPELAAVVGKDSASRQEALKGVWAYIKANDLQDPLNKRSIIADTTLQAVFKQETATMYEVMKLMSPHVRKME